MAFLFENGYGCIFVTINTRGKMKSERQKKIEKHANMINNEKRRRRIALFISAGVIAIPLFLKYYFDN